MSKLNETPSWVSSGQHIMVSDTVKIMLQYCLFNTLYVTLLFSSSSKGHCDVLSDTGKYRDCPPVGSSGNTGNGRGVRKQS